MTKRSVLGLLLVALMVHFIVSSAFAAPAKELRQAIETLSYASVQTASFDGVLVEAYKFVQKKFNLPPVEPGATMRFKGYDVSKLVRFAEMVEKNSSPAVDGAAKTVIEAIKAIREIHESSYAVSEDVFSAAYMASESAIGFAKKINSLADGVPVGPELRAKIISAAANVVRGTVNVAVSYLPPEVAKDVPVYMQVCNEICARLFGVPGPSPLVGAYDAMVRTVGRVVMSFTHGIGFFPRTQKTIDRLGDAALNSAVGPLTPERKARLDGHIKKVKAQVEKARQIFATERRTSALSKDLAGLAGLLSALDPTKVTAVIAAAAGGVSAGSCLYSLYSPLKKHSDLVLDMGDIVTICCGDTVEASPARDTLELDAAAKSAIEEKQKKMKALLSQYVTACRELAELHEQSSGQKEFFLKLKEVEKLDYEISRLSLSK